MNQHDTPVRAMRDAIEQMETAYEFLISFAGRGLGREETLAGGGKIREYVREFEAALGDGLAAAQRIPEVHASLDTDSYESFVTTMEGEVAEARTVLRLLDEQDAVTSPQVDNVNGMSVFQSVVMKFFFLDELTDHLERPVRDE